jgi:glycosyltransferase involved in cell wall biosynthesis
MTASQVARPRLVVIILTYNEAENLAQALESVSGWADSVLVFDSGSTDETVSIAESYGCIVQTYQFENFGRQRNAALRAAAGLGEWVFFLDADEWLPRSIKAEIDHELAVVTLEVGGYYAARRLIWRGKWIRRGYYPTWILRLVRHEGAVCEERSVNEHIIVPGETLRLRNDFMHEDRKGIGDWIDKHNRYATREAIEAAARSLQSGHLPARFFGSQPERARWLRTRVWNRMPPISRPIVYFLYRYILRGGFLDGSAGFVYHFMQALWYHLLIDIKYLELREKRLEGGRSVDSGGSRPQAEVPS